MSQRAENNFRLELYRDLDEIVSAMKNLAQVELHLVAKAESVQARAWTTTVDALQQLLQHTSFASEPQPRGSNRTIILLGSERGFCGGFNEQIARAFKAQDIAGARVLVMGSRLMNKLAVDHITQAFAGPTTTDEVLPCLQNLMEQLLLQPLPDSLQVLCHGTNGVAWEVLLPVPASDNRSAAAALQIQLPPQDLLRELQWQMVQQGLLRQLLVSLKNENRHRLQQMEGAREHLEELTQNLRLRINALRQQEIVEEIEVIFADQPQ